MTEAVEPSPNALAAQAPQAAAGARIVAHRAYRLRTLTVHDDSLVIVLRGTKELISPARTVTVQAGQAVMLAADTTWDVVNRPDGTVHYEALAMAFDGDAVARTASMAEPPPPHNVRHAQVQPTGQTLLDAARRTLAPDLSPAMRHHRLNEVLLCLAEQGWTYAPRQNQPWTERLRQLVGQRPDADWSAARVATAFHTSESTLRRRLAAEHASLLDLVRQTRLETALALLQTTDLSVGEVAHRCGWPSHSRFSAAFLARWGVLPSQVAQLGRNPVNP